MKKLKITVAIALFFLTALVTWCASEADITSRNLSREADRFNVERRIVFYNGITDSYMLTIEWKCSLWNFDDTAELTVTCKTWEDEYKKHFLWLSDNVTYFVEQIESKWVSNYRYKVIFRPATIIPDIEVDLP
jgi:hypothetical protein